MVTRGPKEALLEAQDGHRTRSNVVFLFFCYISVANENITNSVLSVTQPRCNACSFTSNFVCDTESNCAIGVRACVSMLCLLTLRYKFCFCVSMNDVLLSIVF